MDYYWDAKKKLVPIKPFWPWAILGIFLVLAALILLTLALGCSRRQESFETTDGVQTCGCEAGSFHEFCEKMRAKQNDCVCTDGHIYQATMNFCRGVK